ncbi:MAG: hypothetical protein J0M29_00080 [Chitinophagales bacterium]|nr:hypothetical protein [Chitinophagales bacterium]
MTITKFEDLKCWKAARILTKSAFLCYLFEDVAYLPIETLNQLHKEVDDAISLTVGFIRYLNKQSNQA